VVSEELKRFLRRHHGKSVPHNEFLGLEVVDLDERVALFRLPYQQKLVGNPENGVLHGGAITSLMDACCGAAVFLALPEPQTIATLDLRIDYLKPAVPPRDVMARATCFKLTRHVAFVRCIAFHDTEEESIATATGTFMVGSPSSRTTGALAKDQGESS
jgi:uncharacterized protein (TIGR00369 family)